MKRIISLLLLLFVCITLIASPGAAAARPAGQSERPAGEGVIFLPLIFQTPGCIQSFTTISPDNLDYELQTVALINQERTSRGLSPLAIVPELTQSARLESRYMADNNFWGHTWPDGTSPWKRMEWACYDYRTAGENIAGGYSTPAAVVSAWMNSDGHRAAILNPSFTEIGLGYAYNASSTYGRYWTANFGDR
jgi:uncharacterized protein YkwD